jgi:hypothetical protein
MALINNDKIKIVCWTPDDYIIEGEVEEGRLYEEANFNKIIEIKEREAKRVQIFMIGVNKIINGKKFFTVKKSCSTPYNLFKFNNLIHGTH